MFARILRFFHKHIQHRNAEIAVFVIQCAQGRKHVVLREADDADHRFAVFAEQNDP